ncbi:hypothetical protein [Nocardia veterana]|uniref:Uncharacterized protein n=1 Tax=Nocardia veterana TaxID=132249 RepID=A0A7X6M2Z8_9NOCA|nr:hypothetical protein [Nocardia veterana]NKY89355.1 hypothetical protein [Nocardia veterana]
MIDACPDEEISGYGGGPYSWHPEYLDEPLFWISYLGAFFRDPELEELLFGPDWDAAAAFDEALWAAEDWPAFTVSLPSGRRVDVVYRTIPGDLAIDLVLHDPAEGRSRTVASTEDAAGQVLSWSEVVSAAESNDGFGRERQLLLLLPVIDLDDLPPEATAVLAEALTQCTAVDEPRRTAEQLIAVGSA